MKPADLPHAELTGVIIGAAMQVHRTMGRGFLEAVYRNALAFELRQAGLDVEVEQRIRVCYRGVVVGEYVADLMVEGSVIAEIKAVRVLAVAHEVQLVNYLTATGIEVGLLLNFGAPRLEFKRKVRSLPVPSIVGPISLTAAAR
jgi:GxxExxY protein